MGINAGNLPLLLSADELIGNRTDGESQTGRLPITSLALQIAASAAVAESIKQATDTLAATIPVTTADLTETTDLRFMTDAEKTALNGGSFWRGLTYATISALTLDLVPGDGIIAWCLEDNNDYIKAGATTLGSWSIYGPHRSEQDEDRTKYALRQVWPTRKIGAQGGGGLFWDGATTTGATSASGGIFIASGQTGIGSYLESRFKIDAAFSQANAGRTYRFVMLLRTSSQLLAELTASGSLKLTTIFDEIGVGTTGIVANKKFVQQSPTMVSFEVDYTFVGDEVELQQRMTVASGNPAVAADAHFFAEETGFFALDAKGQRGVVEYLAAPRPSNLLPVVRLRRTITLPAREIQQGRGVVIPAGSTGNNIASLRFGVPLYNLPAGSDVIFSFIVTTTADFDTETVLNQAATKYSNSGASSAISSNITRRKLSSTSHLFELTYTVDAGYRALELQVFPNTVSSVVRTSDGSMTLTSASMEILRAPIGSISSAYSHYRECMQADIRDRPDNASVGVSVGKTGVEQFSSIRLGANAIGRGDGPQYQRLLSIGPGTYTGEMSPSVDIVPDLYVKFWGVLGEGSTIIDAQFPDDQASQDLINGILMNRTSYLDGITVDGKNFRYPLHWEAGGNPLAEISKITNATFRHRGSTVWASPTGSGIGMHPGQRLSYDRCTIISPDQAIGFHDNVKFNAPCHLSFSNGSLTALDADGVALGISCYGSGVMSNAHITNTSLNGFVVQRTAGWFAPDFQPANRGGYKMVFSGCTPFSWYTDTVVDCLEILSIPGVTSDVQLSDTALPILFGVAPDKREGGLGYASRIRAQGAISKEVAGVAPTIPVTLGEKLGDRSVASVTLGVRFDFATTYYLVLDQNYTAMDNATIVAALNSLLATAMGGSTGGRQFVISRPYTDRAPIFQPTRERMVKNAHSSAILKKALLAWSGRGVVPMTSAHAADEFAGIAMADALVGREIRILNTGYVNERHLAFTGAAAISTGDKFEIGATAGEIVEGSTRPILRAVDAIAGKATFAIIGRDF